MATSMVDLHRKEEAMSSQQLEEVATGDLIEIEGRRVGDTPRVGEILEVLGPADRPHYRVRWTDGHESVFYPAGGTTIRRSRASAATEELARMLRDADVEFELLPHRRTHTAASEARALDVLPQETAKTVVARFADGYVRAVVPASRRVDPTKLGAAVGAETTLLTETDLGDAYPEFELGAVPPFGGREGDRVVVDTEIANCEYVVLEAGVHDKSLRLRARDLIQVAEGEVAEIGSG
jgi:Ala-tRNA(Pro) deacylase